MRFLDPPFSVVAVLAVATSVLAQPGRHASRSVTDETQVTSSTLLGREADSSVEMLSRRAYKIALPIGKGSLKNLWTVTKAHGPKAGLMYALSSKVRLAYKAEHVTWKNRQIIMRSKWRNHGANVPPANQQKGGKVVGKIRKVLKIKSRQRRSLLARQASAPLRRRSPLGGVITGLKTAGRYVKDTAKVTYKHGIGAGTTFAKSASARQNYRKAGFQVMMDVKKGKTIVYNTKGVRLTAEGGSGFKSVNQLDGYLADVKKMYKQGGIHRRSPLGGKIRLVDSVAGIMQKRAPIESRAVITTTENSAEHVLQKRCGALKACWEEVGKIFKGRESELQQEPSRASQGLLRDVGAPRVQKMSADQHSPSYNAFTDKSPQRTKGRIAWQGERLTKDNIPRQIKIRIPRPVAQAWLGEP
ncbi:hypothetical protein CBOM_00180 [Ceraceosorus bombacis]|uniref:Uncharacterized protein n=1 Tax=Ceraceosorus bombacis TaxID=401625 RepID=A0A0N7L8X2_9BASI|nr:hypothetical protein CBOM_00180 [Ceraceosorus bombacis]